MNAKLDTILDQNPNLKVMHFVKCIELFNYLNTLSNTECLLSDYELLKQPTNGLEVIRLSKIRRTTLVTSHYSNSNYYKNSTTTKNKNFIIKISSNHKN